MNIQELRRDVKPTAGMLQNKKRHPMVVVLDGIYDVWNVGGIFRLADNMGAREVILCEQTPTPPNKKIKRASINTENWIDWSYRFSTEKAISDLKRQGYQIIALETGLRSIDYKTVHEYNRPVAVVLGNEVHGISETAIKLADLTLNIPTYGWNNSLNVGMAFAVIGFEIISKIKSRFDEESRKS